jgi:hypothetical protein
MVCRDNLVQDNASAPGQDYVAYAYCTAHPVLQWLPTKLAEWIGSNLCDDLGIHPKQGSLWTASKLNEIITDVKTQIILKDLQQKSKT